MAESAKVVTEHPEAAKAIEGLREIAKALKVVGDENVQLKAGSERIATLEGEVDTLGQKLIELQGDGDRLEEWSDLLEDFRRGLVDRDELLERTIGT